MKKGKGRIFFQNQNYYDSEIVNRNYCIILIFYTIAQ